MKTIGTRLSSLRTGDKCVLESFTDEAMKQKLLEMGCLPGEVITIDRRAPLGCPMAIIVSGATICIRIDEARNVLVKRVP